MLGGKREGVDAAKLTVWCILDELFDRVHRLRLRRLSQNSEEGFGFARKFHDIIGLITVAVTVWLRKTENKSQMSQPSPSAISVPSPQYLSDSSRTDQLVAERDRCDNAKQNENRQNDELREFEWWLGLCRSKHFQRRYFFVDLNDRHEHIEIKSDYRTNDVNPAPMADELTRVSREDRHRHYDQRHDSQRDSRRETMERKEEPCHAGRNGRDQEPFRPTIEAFTGEQSEQNDQAGKNSDQADHHVHESVCLQYHDASPLKTGLMVRGVSFHFRDRSASAPHARSSWRHVSFEKNPAESLRIHFGEHRKLFRNGDSKQGVGVNLLFHQLRRSGDQRIRKLAAECAHAQARRRTLRTVPSSRKDRSLLNANRQRLLRPASTPAFPHAR